MAQKRRKIRDEIPQDKKNRDSNGKKGSKVIVEKIRVDGEIKRRENKYYSRLAERFRVAGFVFFLLFVVFCGVMMARYGEYVTYDNFVYLIRDFDSMDRNDSHKVSEIKVEIGASAVTRPFRGGFAVAERDSVTVYDSTGVVLLSERESFSYPALALSDKYLIAYDIGGYSYSVYNAVTRVATRKTEFPIVCASVCSNGAFTVTTESDEAKYVTEVYNTALRNTMNIYKDKYVVSSAVSSDGEWVCTASLAESGADFACEVSFYKVGEESARNTALYSMAMPLSCVGLEGGRFLLVCDDAVRFYSSEGTLIAEKPVTGNGILSFDAASHGCVLVCRENAMGTRNRVYAFDSEGNIIYDAVAEERVTSVHLAAKGTAEAGYLVCGDEVVTLAVSGNLKKSFDSDVSFVITTDAGAFAYSTDKAVLLESE